MRLFCLYPSSGFLGAFTRSCHFPRSCSFITGSTGGKRTNEREKIERVKGDDTSSGVLPAQLYEEKVLFYGVVLQAKRYIARIFEHQIKISALTDEYTKTGKTP